MKNQPKTMKNHGNPPGTMKNQQGGGAGISKNVTDTFRYTRGVTTDLLDV